MKSSLSIYILALILPIVLNAEEISPDQLSSISVTATREAQETINIPASVGVISAENIALDSPSFQKELFNSIAGVRVTQTGSSLGHMTSIRMPLNTGPYYLFLQDGIPIQSSGFFNHNGLAYTNFTSAGSAEVLKGASTALYGSDAIAATINVISNDPSLSDGYKIKSDIGSDGFVKLGLLGGKQFENSSLGFEFSHSHNDGWRDHTTSERQELNLTHYADYGDKDSFKTILSANKTQADMAGSLIGLTALNTNPESVGDIQDALDSGLALERKFDFVRLSTEWLHELDDTTEISSIFYLRSNRNQYIASWEKNLPRNDSKEKTLGMMFKVAKDSGNTHWIVGTDVEITQSNRTYEQLFDFVPASKWGTAVAAGSIYDYDVDYLAISPYVRAEHNLSDKLSLSAGLRYDTSQFDYTNNLADGRYAASSYSRPSSDNDPSFEHLSPKFSLAYQIDKNQNLYFRYANGFRIPQASRLYSLRTDNIAFQLDSEITDTFEIGYKVGTKKIQFVAALYHMSIDDSIVRRENAGGDRYYINAGKTTHKGIELTGLYHFNKQLSTRLTYSYSEHHYVNDAVYNDNEQAAAPNDLANFRVIYKPSALPGLNTVFEVEHVGEYWLDDDNTRTYDGYTVGHLKATYQANKKLNLSAKINNISDEIYAENASFSYGKEKYTPAAPRQLFFGLEYQL